MKTLGKYEVLAELATGSMGVLYRARDTVLDREVALKTIAGTGSLDPELKERFYREARAGARLHHPNVITVYELGEHEGLVFIALELLSGCDLRQFIARRSPLPALQKIAIMAAVCDGLHHAHQNDITHRDIKPSNIFLTDNHVPKILDFGVARLSASKLTLVGRVLGTPFYMAPEQIMGQPCDARSDLFSLAIVTFEFLTFAHPFASDSIPKRIVNDAPDSVVERNPELPRALDAVLFKALARKPDQRYQSAAEFGQALREAARQDAPAPAVPKSLVPEALKPPVPEPTLPRYANTEHKMSAILMALQGFDEAIEQRNLAVARNALSTVETLAKIDDRFATAASESRARLTELEASMPPEPAPPPPQVATPAPVPEPVRQEPPPRTVAPVFDLKRAEPSPPPAAVEPQRTPPAPAAPAARDTTPAAAPSGRADDVTSMFHVSDVPAAPRAGTPVNPAVSRPPVTHPPRTTAIPAVTRPPGTPAPRSMPPRVEGRTTAPPVPQPVTPPQPVNPLSSLFARFDSKVLIVAAAAAGLILIALLVWLFSGSGKVALVPAAGTAQVSVAQTALRQAASDSSDLVVTLKKGDTVNVIRPPRSRNQEWTEVQYVAGKTASPAGAVHTADLTNWISTKPDVALSFIEMYAPGPDASETELRQYAQKVSGFMEHFSGTPQQAEAKAELDKTNAALARPAAGKGAAPAKSAPVVNPEKALARAEEAWEDGDYNQAERLLKRLLQDKPGFPAAQMLLDKVQKAKKLEDSR